MTYRRVLIVHPYGIGDLLFLTPVFRALKLLPTVEKIDLLLGSRTEELVRNNPYIDEIFIVDKDLFQKRNFRENFKEAMDLSRKLRARRYDLLLDYSFRNEYSFFAQFFWNIPRRAGFDYKSRGIFLTHRLPIEGGFHKKHAVDYCADVAELAGVQVRDRFLEFYLDENSKQKVKALLRAKHSENSGFLAVSVGGGESWGKDAHFKRWRPEFFAEFCEKLKSLYDFDKVMLVGGPKERPLAEQFISHSKFEAINLAGSLSLGETAALIEKSILFLGNDGGLLHLAHALRKPVIGFYGPVNPAVYGPTPASPQAVAIYKEGLECRPCYQNFRYKTDCPHRKCLTQFSPEEAMQALLSRVIPAEAGIHGSPPPRG